MRSNARFQHIEKPIKISLLIYLLMNADPISLNC